MYLKAPAKINFYLEVIKKREDGYHEICSLIQAIDLYDEIFLQETKDGKIKIECDTPEIPVGQNLAEKAAELLRKTKKIKKGINIKIKKNIPIGAGLGGGSSDAATVLKGLNKLWNLNISQKELTELGIKIGCDVPFFIIDHTAWVEGKGEKVSPLPSLNKKIILVVPSFQISSKFAYEQVDLSNLTSQLDINKIKQIFFQEKGLVIFNRLEKGIFKKFPLLEEIKQYLVFAGLKFVGLSGSGPAIFGVIDNYFDILELKEKIQKKFNPWIWYGNTI